MRFASLVLSSLLIVGACPILGCGHDSDEQPVAWSPPGPPTPETSISFEQSGQLALGLRESRTLHIVVDPPAPHEVNFVLLGASLDATLDRATVVTNHEGRASIVLRSPNKSTTFRVRAWIKDGPADEITVATSGDGFAPVEILPNYMGNRSITSWKASIVARTRCADVVPQLPNEIQDALVAYANIDEPLVIPKAPVGPSLAVMVQAGEFAWGCSDASGLVTGEKTTVKVNVIDKPLVIGETNLDVTFSIKPEPTAYYSLLDKTSKSLFDELLPDSADAGQKLLDAIAARVPESQAQAFVDARTIGGWDALAQTHLSSQPSSLRSTLEAWFLFGLVNEPSELVARLTAMSQPAGAATLSPIRFGSVAAADAGMPTTHLAKLTVDTGDVVHLGSNFLWLPTRYVGGIVQNAAMKDAPEGTTMTDALASIIGCDALGQTLIGFDTCDANCLAGLCHEVLAEQWQNGLDASAADYDIGHITVAAAATVSVDDKAIPLSFQGTWLGNITTSNTTAKIGNAEISATVPEAPSEP